MQIYNALQLKNGAKVEYNKMGTLTQPIQFLPKDKKDPPPSRATFQSKSFWCKSSTVVLPNFIFA